jgi:hypothetical protein
MKRIGFCLLLIVLFATAVWAGSSYNCARWTLSADVSTATRLPNPLQGTKLYKNSITATADNIVTFAINDANGIQLYTVTTSGAIAGEAAEFTNAPLMSSEFTYTFTGMSSGTATIEVCGEK